MTLTRINLIDRLLIPLRNLTKKGKIKFALKPAANLLYC